MNSDTLSEIETETEILFKLSHHNCVNEHLCMSEEKLLAGFHSQWHKALGMALERLLLQRLILKKTAGLRTAYYLNLTDSKIASEIITRLTE